MIMNFQDATVIYHLYGPPDLFVTFAYEPEWPAVTDALGTEPGHHPHSRSDMACRSYIHHENKTIYFTVSRPTLLSALFIPVGAYLFNLWLIFFPPLFILPSLVPNFSFYLAMYATEFQKKGRTHMHILVWLSLPQQAEKLISKIPATGHSKVHTKPAKTFQLIHLLMPHISLLQWCSQLPHDQPKKKPLKRGWSSSRNVYCSSAAEI